MKNEQLLFLPDETILKSLTPKDKDFLSILSLFYSTWQRGRWQRGRVVDAPGS